MLSRRHLLASPLLAAAQPTPPPIIDCHAHLHHHSIADWQRLDRALIDAADKLGIGRLCCSTLPPRRPATPESWRECNQWTAEARDRFPGRILGWVHVNPGYREALDDVQRLIEDRGFIGVKLYNDYWANEPVVFPLVELCIRLRVPILHHAGHTMWLGSPQPRISDGSHFSDLSRRYPEAMIICAHVCGGGDWEWEIKSLRNARGVYLDTSGSVADEGVVEMAVKLLGVERLLFGCDMSMTASMGRLRGAAISEADRAAILGGNMERLLSKRGRA
ncbi:MAG: amidohydrolase family protein [Bryobacteraceae bacterium]